MKLFSLSSSALLVVALALVMSRQCALGALQGATNANDKSRVLQENGAEFHLTPLHYGGCIQTQGKATTSSAILASEETPFCTTFSLDNDGLIHASESNLCLQAGHGRVLEDRSKLRLYPCDRMNMFQRFAWTGRDGKLKLKTWKYDDLCLTFRGDNADINDPIIFKYCHSIPSTHVQWQGKSLSGVTVGL